MQSPTFWQSDPLYQYEIDGFALFMGLTPPYPSSSILKNGLTQSYATNWIVQVPYLPVVTIREYSSWQANDPLVHYLASDLKFQTPVPRHQRVLLWIILINHRRHCCQTSVH